jgi:acetyl esterase/lipase
MASPAKHGKQAVLYLHGGAYSVGSAATHRAITSHLAKAAHASVFAINYRLAPEHIFPAATDDALEAYRWLLDNGYSGNNIFIAGDSAGGGLALATAIQVRDLSLPAPGGLMLLSPWVDLTAGALDDSTHINDAMLSRDALEHNAALYAETQRDHPLVSPLHANLHDLPATLLIVGTEEILLEQAEHLYQQLAATGNKVRLSAYQEMWHVFPAQAGILATADAAINEMAEWMSN